MLTQRTPFEADTPLAVLMKHVNDPLPLPCKIDPTIPEPFERVVLKALAKGPDDRYQGAEEMAQALREAAEEAARLVQIEYEQLPGVYSVSQALADDAPLVREPELRPDDDPLRSTNVPTSAEWGLRKSAPTSSRAAQT